MKEIKTLQQLADYINSEDCNQFIVNDTIAKNGWTDLCGENEFDYCHDGESLVTISETTGEAVVVEY